MGRGPEMKRCITSLCQSCDHDFLSNGLVWSLGGKGPETRKLETSLWRKTQCMQITSCIKPLDATVSENNVTKIKKIANSYLLLLHTKWFKVAEKLKKKITINFNLPQNYMNITVYCVQRLYKVNSYINYV